MKFRRVILTVSALTIAIVSCNNEKEQEEDSLGLKVSFTLEAPVVEYGQPAGAPPYRKTWVAGDKVSMFAFKAPAKAGVPSSGNVVNFSSNRFAAASAGSSATFSGKIPSLDNLAQGDLSLHAIFPAKTLTVSAQSIADASGKPSFKITGPSIAGKQDGTGWRYCFFTSSNGVISAKDRMITTLPSFSLVNTVLKFRVISAKPLRQILIEQLDESAPGISGAFTVFTSETGIADGCDSRSITIENGGQLPVDILVACGAIPKDRLLKITFQATDDSSVDHTLKTGMAYSPGRIYDLGNIDLREWISSEPASQAVKNMGMGVSVGGLDMVDPSEESLPERRDEATGLHRLDRNDPVTYETNGNKDRLTQTTFNVLKETGFTTIRIPVTWFPHMDPPYSTSAIDQVWLEHIQSVVDLIRNAGMYAIINIHHDAGSYDYCWLVADLARYNDASAILKNIWTQIANHFKDYDYHLLFEGYNEICDENHRWFVPGGPDGYKAANALNQDFVDAVRATGGNNLVRNLIVSTYTASDRAEAMQGFTMPNDITEDHLIVQIHSYLPIPFITARPVGDNSRMEFYEEDKLEIDDMFDRAKANILDKGWPCVLGEYGAFFKRDADGNRNEPGRGAHGYYYTMKALRRGITPIYWYNPMEYRDRDEGRWTFPVLKDSLAKAWSDFQAGRHPEIE